MCVSVCVCVCVCVYVRACVRACVCGMVDVEGCMVWVGECERVLFSALPLYVEDWTQYMECFVNIIIITGSRNVVASVSDCRSEDLGFESHQSHNRGIFFLALAGSYLELGALWVNGKAGTTQPSFIHFTDASLRVLL